MYRTDFWTLWGKARVVCFERTASKHVYYLGWNRSPAQVGCMRQVLGPGALGSSKGIGWRGRWEGGSGWEIHVNPWLIHVNVWQKPLQYCKVISLQLIKINEKNWKRKKEEDASWKEGYDKPREHIKKQRHHFANKCLLVKAMAFPVVEYGCENWTIKKAKCWRIDAVELWSWRRLLRVPWQQGNQSSQYWRKSALSVHWKGWCWSWSSNNLATWCEELTHWKRPWCLGRVKAKGEESRMRWLDSITDSVDMNLMNSGKWWGTGRPGLLSCMWSHRVGHHSDWTTTASKVTKLLFEHNMLFYLFNYPCHDITTVLQLRKLMSGEFE